VALLACPVRPQGFREALGPEATRTIPRAALEEDRGKEDALMAININPKNKGKLRKTAKTKKGRKIPVKKLQAMKKSKNPKTRKRANFALNARKWRKGKRK
jgi:hypothetical protein